MILMGKGVTKTYTFRPVLVQSSTESGRVSADSAFLMIESAKVSLY